jgi:hypothetical protein
MAVTFSIRFDTRSKEVLLDSLRKELIIAETEIRSGNYSDDALVRHEEILQHFRGVLYAKPETQEVPTE